MTGNMNVTIYTSPTCGSCQMIEEYLRSRGVEFETIDVARDQKALKALVEKTGKMLTPVIEIGDEVIVGFNKPEIDQILNLAGGRGERQKNT